MKKSYLSVANSGFTIVELLVVIVVIGILATITIVAFTGIRQKAIAVSLQSDLDNASKQLKMYQATDDNGNYPGANECPTPSAANICLKASGTNAFTYTPNNSTTPKSFTLDALNGSIRWRITNDSTPVAVILPTSTLKQIAVGDYHTCAIGSDDNAYCWGYNGEGELGNNSYTTSFIPVAVNTTGVLSGKTIKSITVGARNTCVIASDDHAYCWGQNNYGQFGNNSNNDSNVPVAVDTTGVLSGKTIKSISAGLYHACAIASDDLAYCWGYNGYGEFGNNSNSASLVPVAVSTSGVLSGKTLKSISVGYLYTCAIASDNKPYCWGDGEYGQLGNNSTASSLVPVAVDTSGVLSGKTVSSIEAGGAHACVIASDDHMYCWGLNNSGQIGDNSSSNRLTPVSVDTSGVLSGKTVKYISTNGFHTCAIASDDLAYCWGRNDYGQLGNNLTSNSLIPVAVVTSGVLSGKTVAVIQAGGNAHSCATTSDNQVYCWGYNGFGNLGNNTNANSPVPVAVQSLP